MSGCGGCENAVGEEMAKGRRCLRCFGDAGHRRGWIVVILKDGDDPKIHGGAAPVWCPKNK